MHGSIREQLCNAKLIVMNDNEESLHIYSDELCKIYINEQIRFYLTSMNVLQSYIVESESLFNILIVKDDIK